jgi:mono/diheme cytochrome c family protein
VQIPTTFYQVAPELTQLRISQVMIEEATKKALNEFKADLAKQQLPPLPQERVPLGPSPVSDTTDPLANLVESIPRASLGTTNVQQVFNTHCVKCHGAGDTVNLTNAAAYPASKREKLLACVEHDAGEKAMPPKTKLPPEVLRQVRRWAFDK